ncbi:hypothetical protein KHQ81_15370 (plasmid) [Mycoplasmatota bacterium]|nr:hypothetical protein KHQ81_15370 [Mycoplasmatota bacterium]
MTKGNMSLITFSNKYCILLNNCINYIESNVPNSIDEINHYRPFVTKNFEISKVGIQYCIKDLRKSNDKHAGIHFYIDKLLFFNKLIEIIIDEVV